MKSNGKGGRAGVVAIARGYNLFVKSYRVKPASVDHDGDNRVNGLFGRQIETGGEQIQSGVWGSVRS